MSMVTVVPASRRHGHGTTTATDRLSGASAGATGAAAVGGNPSEQSAAGSPEPGATVAGAPAGGGAIGGPASATAAGAATGPAKAPVVTGAGLNSPAALSLPDFPPSH